MVTPLLHDSDYTWPTAISPRVDKVSVIKPTGSYCGVGDNSSIDEWMWSLFNASEPKQQLKEREERTYFYENDWVVENQLCDFETRSANQIKHDQEGVLHSWKSLKCWI